MITQTWALLLDAYRELNAKKLFWITMILSGLVVLAFAAVGINEQGLTIFHWELPAGGLNTSTMTKEFFYKQLLFSNLGVRLWLAWGATILALISTAGMIPDFVTGGALPVMLAKPISRLRLFLTKYMTGLLFVALQVSVFSVASFVVLGVRAGVWEFGVFLAVPLVVIFFSYLFCVCALIGLVTRSTIAALILTGLFWFSLFTVNTAEQALLAFRTMQEQRVAAFDAQIEIARAKRDAAAETPSGGVVNALRNGIITPEGRQAEVERLEERRADIEGARRVLARWHNGVLTAKTILPKTQETVQLLDRTLISQNELDEMLENAGAGGGAPIDIDTAREDAALGVRVDQTDVTREIERKRRERPISWVVGASLLFEAFILGIACLIFVRRDY